MVFLICERCGEYRRSAVAGSGRIAQERDSRCGLFAEGPVIVRSPAFARIADKVSARPREGGVPETLAQFSLDSRVTREWKGVMEEPAMARRWLPAYLHKRYQLGADPSPPGNPYMTATRKRHTRPRRGRPN